MPRSELNDLHAHRLSVESAEEDLAAARAARDRAIVRAVSAGVSERAVAAAAGVSRGWVFQCKNRYADS